MSDKLPTETPNSNEYEAGADAQAKTDIIRNIDDYNNLPTSDEFAAKNESPSKPIDDSEMNYTVESLWDSEKKFHNLIKSIPMGMHFYKLEQDGRLIFEGGNPAADRLLGTDNQKFVGMTMEEAFPFCAGTELPDKFREVAKNGVVWESERLECVGDKAKGTFQVVAFQVSENRMASMFFDVTERKMTEEALKESEEKFRNLAEWSPNMIFINRRGKIVYANHRCDACGSCQ